MSEPIQVDPNRISVPSSPQIYELSKEVQAIVAIGKTLSPPDSYASKRFDSFNRYTMMWLRWLHDLAAQTYGEMPVGYPTELPADWKPEPEPR